MAQLKQTETKTIFMRGPSAGMRVALFGLLSVILMTLDHRYLHLESTRGALSLLVLPLQQAVDAPTSMVRWLSDTLMSREELQEENRRLRQRHFLTTAQLQKLTVLEAENRRLRTLLESAANIPQRAIIAELINVDDDPYRHRILVGKGTTHGVRRGQPVLDANGVVGQIMHAGPLASTAVLITDPSHALPVQVDRNGLRGLLLGTGRFDRLDLPHVPNNADVQIGDLLITSGLGGRFPRGYPVAIMLALAPMPDWADRLRPQWVAMVLIYWAMALPERVGVGVGWMVGILLDVARSALLGQHALALAVLAFVTHKSHMRLRVLPLWQQAATVLLFLLVYQLVLQWINGMSGYPPQDLWYLVPPFTSTLLWPWVFVVLRDVRRRLTVV